MYLTTTKRLLCATLFFIIIISSFSSLILPASASIKPNYSAYEYGEAYKTSKYYSQLLDAKSKLTGDHRYDVVMIALSQLGYHEGDSDADMDGWNLGGTNNFVEYNRLFCKLEGIWGYAWCAAFVSAAALESGMTDILLSDLFNELQMPLDAKNVTNVTFTDYDLMGVTVEAEDAGSGMKSLVYYVSDDAIREMLSTDGPFLLHVAVKEEDNVMPMTEPGATVSEMRFE